MMLWFLKSLSILFWQAEMSMSLNCLRNWATLLGTSRSYPIICDFVNTLFFLSSISLRPSSVFNYKPVYMSLTGNLKANAVQPLMLYLSAMSPPILRLKVLLQDSPSPMLWLKDFLAPMLFLISLRASNSMSYLSGGIPIPVSSTITSSIPWIESSMYC